MTPWQLATLLLGMLCAVIVFSMPRDIPDLAPIFQYLFHQDGPGSLLALAVAVVAAICVDRGDRLQALLRKLAANPRWAATAAFAVSALGAWFAYHHHPLSMDEYAAHMQSEIFAAGQLAGHIPPQLANQLILLSHQGWFVHVNHVTGAVASAYWPGFSLVMAPFTLAGVPWLCNPAITGMTVLGLAKLLDELLDDPAARGFGLLAALASPTILINGMSYYGLPLQLLCIVMFTLGMVRGTRRQMLAAGAWAALGMTAVNPVPIALYVLPWLVWTLVRRPDPWPRLGWLALGSLPVGLVLGIGWRVFLTTYIYEAKPTQLGSDIGTMLNVFQPPSASLLIARAMALVKLCVWAVPGLPVLAVAACLQQEKHRLAIVFAACAVINLVGYLFVPFDQGHGWGYRYFHATWLVLPVLGALAVQHFARDPKLRQRAYGFAFVACMGTLLLSLPLRVAQVESFIRTHLQQIPERLPGNERQAVFVDMECGFYTADLVQNDPFYRSNEIRLVSRSYGWDARVAAMFGSAPRVVANGRCGHRWLLD